MKRNNIILDQVNASIVDTLEQQKEKAIEMVLKEIERVKQVDIVSEQEALDKALKCVDNVREFIRSPDKILGSDATKHGEIAEQVEVNIRNARDILNKAKESATFEGVGRTAPEDYIIDGMKVQSKFINGSNNTLKHVLEHMGKYKQFTQDGGYYHVPKDQYKIMLKIANDRDVEDLNLRTVSALQDKIREIELKTGQNFQEVVKPSLSEYGAVQQGKIIDTLEQHENELRDMSNKNQQAIKDEANKQRQTAQKITEPSLREAAKYGLISATIGGVMSTGVVVYKKHKAGKKISNYNSTDWKEVGFEFGKGSIKGGISGTSIYALTKFANCSAPLAGAVVSTSFGVISLVNDYVKGELSVDELVEQGQALCMESAIVAIGSAIGSTVIPIPVLGTVVGSFTAKILLDLTKEYLNGREQRLINELNKNFQDTLSKMNYECKIIMDKIQQYYNKLNGLMDAAFNFEVNYKLAFTNSIVLCRELGVEEKEILHNIQEIDDYFLI